jgi:hypothetical protein
MRKTFNVLLPVLVFVLGYLVYAQWFSPSRPLPYRLPLKSTVPSPLVSLPIRDFKGNESTLEIRNHSYSRTLFLADGLFLNKDFYFSTVKSYHEMLVKQGYQIVYLWAGVNAKDEGAAELISMLQKDQYATHINADSRVMAQYQNLGLQIAKYPFMFVCDKDGNLIYQQEALQAKQLIETLSSLDSKEVPLK